VWKHQGINAAGVLGDMLRIVSYFTMCDCISGAEQPVMLELPNQWLWDIIDEFIYQVASLTYDFQKS